MSAQGEKFVYEIHFQPGKFCLFNRGLMRRARPHWTGREACAMIEQAWKEK
jgi:hypothetical protein